MLEVRSISRRYGYPKAVDNVSFSIEPGEIVGLLGHNGAGKTTIMKLISGYLEPDSGSISLNNRLITLGDKTLQRSLGYLPENLPVYPELTVASYLQYAAEIKGFTGKDQRTAIKQVIESTDLSDRFLSPISTLSRGMKQRVGVAQALLGYPSLLILDEPTNGLDPAQTEQMRQLIQSISESATVILSTHIMQEVEAICSRALIFNRASWQWIHSSTSWIRKTVLPCKLQPMKRLSLSLCAVHSPVYGKSRSFLDNSVLQPCCPVDIVLRQNGSVIRCSLKNQAVLGIK